MASIILLRRLKLPFFKLLDYGWGFDFALAYGKVNLQSHIITFFIYNHVEIK